MTTAKIISRNSFLNNFKFIYALFFICSPKIYIPEQVHLSLNENPSEMVVMWVRCPETANCNLSYGKEKFNLNQKVTSKTFKFQTGFRIIHNFEAVMKNLKPNTKYFYQITCDGNSTKIFDFKTLPTYKSDIVPTVATIGDLGLYFATSLPRLEYEAQNNQIDVLLHLGDIAYDMYLVNGNVGNEYMRRMEKVASKLPYMVAPGNHEYMPFIGDSGTNYENRFKMPGKYKNQKYSFEVGNVLYIILNSEVYYYKNFDQNDIIEQESWFNQTMQQANKRRDIVPWTVAIIHRPFYCNSASLTRCKNGVNENLRSKLENLFYSSGVDIVLYGHNHHYERMHPVYNKKVVGDKTIDLIRNPKTPIHIINGAGGNQEGLNSFSRDLSDWSAVQIKENGFLKIQAFNYTHLNCKFYSTTSVSISESYIYRLENIYFYYSKNKIKDEFWIYQQFHGSFVTS